MQFLSNENDCLRIYLNKLIIVYIPVLKNFLKSVLISRDLPVYENIVEERGKRDFCTTTLPFAKFKQPQC